jgi:hypothetical protein
MDLKIDSEKVDVDYFSELLKHRAPPKKRGIYKMIEHSYNQMQEIIKNMKKEK